MAARQEAKEKVGTRSRSDRAKIEEAADATKPDAPVEQPNGVFVTRVVQEDGNIGVDVQAIGDVKITEIPTILALGRRLVNSKLDL